MDYFIDEARIQVHAGKGGNGCVSFRRERYVEFGGPNGGDGGEGGSVYVQGNKGTQTLARYKRGYHYKAKNGTHGEGKKCFGKKGADLVLEVPLGTVIYDEQTGRIVANIKTDGELVCVARGGSKGRGNVHFKTSTNQAPRMAEDGQEGQVKNLKMELKVLADIGLIGFPNAGKSTFINKVSNSASQVAPYAFSTLRPFLGVVKLNDWQKFVIADIPGIVEGAHTGKGIGLKFLKHIERSKGYLFIIDLFSENAVEDFFTLRNEMEIYNESLLERPFLVALNKIDAFLKEDLDLIYKDFLAQTKLKSEQVFLTSAVKNEGVQELVPNLYSMIEAFLDKDLPLNHKEALEDDFETIWEDSFYAKPINKAQEEEDVQIFWELGNGELRPDKKKRNSYKNGNSKN